MPSKQKSAATSVVPVVSASKQPAQKKQKISATASTEVSVPVAAAAVSASEDAVKPKAAKAAKKPKASVSTDVVVLDASSSSSSSAAPVGSDGVVGSPESVVPASVESKFAEQANQFLVNINEVCQSLNHLKKEFQVIEKNYSKELKAIQKLSTKRKRKANNRQPSGFVKPTRISDELAVFLDKPLGSEMARTEVTKEISNYISANNLKDTINGRIIHADTKLLELLHINSDIPLTFFNLQRYMCRHFATAASIAAENAAAATAATSVAN